MRRFRIFHETEYQYPHDVRLGAHRLLVRPRDGHDVRIEESRLDITPAATLSWHRDEFDNSVAVATFDGTPTQALRITSEVLVSHYMWDRTSVPLAEHISSLPVTYTPTESASLSAYLGHDHDNGLKTWLAEITESESDTLGLLKVISSSIKESCTYEVRLEEGVQKPAETLARLSGSCRDYAWLFVAAARSVGFAARFVSGYFHTKGTVVADGHTHAWAEVYLPGAGWTGFDPTCDVITGENHIPVAVAILPEAIPPVSGSYIGPSGDAPPPEVRVRVTPA